MSRAQRIVVTGGAGLVGQNLIPLLKQSGNFDLVVLDKHSRNAAKLRSLHPDLTVIDVDLSKPGDWMAEFSGAHTVIQLHAQIGGIKEEDFIQNNVLATKNVLDAMKLNGVQRLIHVSSSVVESIADDWYTNTKKEQEDLVVHAGLTTVILRPTLMFGWFDRKHLGWLSRFMKKSLIFPIPGNGDVIRQPLYAGDFSAIVKSCVDNIEVTGIFNISGCEKISYINIIRAIRSSTNAKCAIVKIPPQFFRLLLKVWSVFDKNPPFTVQQLDALLANEEFEMFDWQKKFGVIATPFSSAINQTFTHPVYSAVVLDF